MPISDRFFGGDEPQQSQESAPDKPAATDEKPAAAERPDATPAPSAGKAEAAEATAEKPDTEAKPEQSRDEHGRFTPKQEDDEKVPRSALIAERRARQEAERLLAERQQPEPLTSDKFFEDPVKSLTEVSQQAEAKALNRIYDMSDHQAGKRHEDWAELTDALVEECRANPALRELAMETYRTSPDPGEAIYEFARNRRDLRLAGGLSGYKEKLEAPLRAQVKELEAKVDALTKKQTSLSQVPVSLNSQPAVDGPEAKLEGPKPLQEIINSRRKRA